MVLLCYVTVRTVWLSYSIFKQHILYKSLVSPFKWQTSSAVYWNVQKQMEIQYIREKQSLYNCNEVEIQYLFFTAA